MPIARSCARCLPGYSLTAVVPSPQRPPDTRPDPGVHLVCEGRGQETGLKSAADARSLGAGRHVGVDRGCGDEGPPPDEDFVEVAASAHPPDGCAVDAEKTCRLELGNKEDWAGCWGHTGVREPIVPGGHRRRLIPEPASRAGGAVVIHRMVARLTCWV